jgi:hypothetical protein
MTEIDNTALGAVKALFSTAEGQKEFIDWVKSPVTQALVAAAREIYHPSPPNDSYSAEYMLGLSVGSNLIVDFFVTPQAVAGAVDRSRRMPEPLYGSTAIRERGDQ